MAMRGYHDTAIELTDEYAIKLLEVVVAEQRKILLDVFNGTKITDIPQMWCLYKEVQGYYESGMQIPDDITLLWSDDNWGNLRRLPTGNETKRAGGAGKFSSLSRQLHPDIMNRCILPLRLRWRSKILQVD